MTAATVSIVAAVSDVTTTDNATVDPCGCGGGAFPLRLRLAVAEPMRLIAIDA